MNPSYLLLRRPLDDAMRRYGAWLDRPALIPPQEVAEDDALDLALDEGEWKGLAVYIFASGPWTVFEELSGGLAARPSRGLGAARGWRRSCVRRLQRCDRLRRVRPSGSRQLVRQFLQDEQDPTADVDVGKLPEEAGDRIVHWADVAKWVDVEDEGFTGRERGWLCDPHSRLTATAADERSASIGRVFFGFSLCAFGIQQFIYGDFVPGRAPAWPAGVPGRLAWAWVSGALLVAAGAAVTSGKRARGLSAALRAG